MPGINADTGKPLSGWDHVVQSIRVILTTMIGTRVMRREFGSELMALVDAPMTDRVVLAVYVATANALARWEPRFRLTSVEIMSPEASGQISLRLFGNYYPRGHLGDFSTPQSRSDDLVIS